MIKLKTKTEFQVPSARGVKLAIIRMIVDGVFFDANNITARGYYYYLDENGQVVRLDSLGKSSSKEWSIVEQVENNFLQDFTNQRNLKNVCIQRLQEFTNMQLTQENGENYGTIASDWEIDI